MRRRQFTIGLYCGILSTFLVSKPAFSQAGPGITHMKTPKFNWPYPRLIAHRGGGTLAPENTLAAMKAGHRFGYRMVEFDVKLSQDLVPILMHDSTLERTTNAQGNASSQTQQELARLDAGSWHSPAFAGEPVPTLEQIARYTQQSGVASNIEIKPTPGDEHRTGEWVANAAASLWTGQAVPPLLSSFSLVSLAAAQQAQPQLPRGWITSELKPGWQSSIAALDLVSLHLRHDKITRELVSEVHDMGLRLAVWTVNDPVKAKELLDWGVDAVITDALDMIHPDSDSATRV